MTILARALPQSTRIAPIDLALLVAATALCAADIGLFIATDPGGIPTPEGLTFDPGVALLIVAGAVSLRLSAQLGNGRLMLGIALLEAAQDLSGRLDGVGPFAFFWDVLPWLADVMLGHLLLRWPRPVLQTRPQRVAVTAGYCALVPLMIVADLFYSGRALGVPAGVWWPTVVLDRPLSVTLYRIGLGAFGALLAVFVVLVGRRFGRASQPERRELAAVAVAIALLVASGVLTVLRDVGASVDADLLGNLALLTVPVALLTAVIVRRVQRALAVEALTVRGVEATGPELVRELRRAMGDPRLDVATYSVELGRYVDLSGAVASVVEPGRRTMFVAATDGSPLARLDVAAALAGRDELAGPIARAALAGLETARLRAELLLRAGDQAAARRELDAAHEAEERLSRMLPGGVPEKLRADPGALGRIDESVVTVLMSDVRGFTTIAEGAPPARLAQQLREHRAAMNDAILGEGGTVMQYVGDAVMAVFGAPFTQSDHAARAVRAAGAMHLAQRAVNSGWAVQGWQPFLLGIGVATGQVATAILGSDARYEYTLVGDTVNLAQRLEDAARPGGTTILSAATADAAGAEGLGFESLPPITVKGRIAPVVAWRTDSS